MIIGHNIAHNRTIIKMVGNMFFLDSEHGGMGKCVTQNSCLFVHVSCFVAKYYFARL